MDFHLSNLTNNSKYQWENVAQILNRDYKELVMIYV